MPHAGTRPPGWRVPDTRPQHSDRPGHAPRIAAHRHLCAACPQIRRRRGGGAMKKDLTEADLPGLLVEELRRKDYCIIRNEAVARVHALARDLDPIFAATPFCEGNFYGRSEERRVGKECVSTCRYRGSPFH